MNTLFIRNYCNLLHVYEWMNSLYPCKKIPNQQIVDAKLASGK